MRGQSADLVIIDDIPQPREFRGLESIVNDERLDEPQPPRTLTLAILTEAIERLQEEALRPSPPVITSPQHYAALERYLRGRGQPTEPLQYQWTPIDVDDLPSNDAEVVRFSQMSAEAEAEMHEWDQIIRGKAK